MSLKQTFPADRLANYERMVDDMIVDRYMAEIDTRIDSIVLEWRATDAFVEYVMAAPYKPWNLEQHRVSDAYDEHRARNADLQQMIEQIRASASHIPAERHADIGFGPYDGNSDKYLAMVLDYAGPDFADDETGSTEWSEHIMRFGRVLLATNDQGFRDADIRADEDEAKKVFAQCEQQYHDWAVSEDCSNYDND